MHKQLCRDERMEPGMVGVMPHDEVFEEPCVFNLSEDTATTAKGGGPPSQGEQLPPGCSGRYKDDITGQPLIDALVREARAKELAYFEEKGVWERRPRAEARQRTGKAAISVRWVDVNKGDDEHPNYRSRLVARQLKAHDRSGESYFAPAPPNEAVRFVISSAATDFGNGKAPCRDPTSEERMQISFVDIARAYFNAKTDPSEPTYVDLPPECDGAGEWCALLLRHMYGTRKAADGWQEEYSSLLVSQLGFSQGLASTCVFVQPERNITCAVHGDDFTAAGPKQALDWFEKVLAEHYELKVGPRLGPGHGDAKEATVLNRVVRWTNEGSSTRLTPASPKNWCASAGLKVPAQWQRPGSEPQPSSCLRTRSLLVPSTPLSGAARPAETTWLLTDLTCSTQQRRFAGGWPHPPS